jgi:tetratricopeptide (TPR) repeat protein
MSAPGPLESEGVQADAQASVLMRRGVQLMTEDRPAAVSEALACFDQALDLRSSLPLDESPPLRHGLAACWLNRADALMRLGGAPQVAEAVRSCDKAIELLRTLPLDAAAITDPPYLLAVVWVNLAGILSAQGTSESEARALSAAIQAIALVAGEESEDLAAAEVGLRARHALCRTFAGRLSSLRPGLDAMPDDVHEATDAVDDGLALIRRWEQKGVARFRDVACGLFRFGSRVYLAASSAAYVEDEDIRAAAQEIVDLHAQLYT